MLQGSMTSEGWNLRQPRSGQPPPQHPSAPKAMSMVSLAKTLLTDYSSLTESVMSAQSQLRRNRIQDDDLAKVKQIIGDQGSRVETLVGRRVYEHTGSRKKTSEDFVPPLEHTLWSHFGTPTLAVDAARHHRLEVIWSKAAKNTKRGVRYLVQHLSEDDV